MSVDCSWAGTGTNAVALASGTRRCACSGQPGGSWGSAAAHLAEPLNRTKTPLATKSAVVLWYEAGHGRPRADTLERIAQLGGVSVDSASTGAAK